MKLNGIKKVFVLLSLLFLFNISFGIGFLPALLSMNKVNKGDILQSSLINNIIDNLNSIWSYLNNGFEVDGNIELVNTGTNNYERTISFNKKWYIGAKPSDNYLYIYKTGTNKKIAITQSGFILSGNIGIKLENNGNICIGSCY